jgi:aconitate decarboxylase
MTEAAFANGTMAHALDFDNCWYPLNHPTSPTLPVILAFAEHHGSSGRDCVTALVTAFEVQARLRLASTGLHTGRGFHKPGTTGLMGAVAAGVKLLDLDEHQALMAFGIGGSRLGSLSLNTGTMTKATHSGNAARMGLESALLASRGWTAAADVFGPQGYFDTLLGADQEPELLVAGFADPLWMVRPGVGFKKYPANYFTHRPIDAALAIRARTDFSIEDIDAVTIRFPELRYVDRPSPATGLDGKFSLQYTTAVALLDGAVTIDSFTDERRFAADVEQLLPKMRVVFDPEISQEFLDLHVEVTVHRYDDSALTERVDALSGMPGVPLSEQERMAKFDACAGRVLEGPEVQELSGLLHRIDELADVRAVMDLARADRPR